MIQGLTALILAGGFATRLWPLTEKRAKPLLPLAGKPLVHHILDKLPRDIPVILSTNAVFQQDFLAVQQQYSDRSLTVFIEDSHSDRGKKGALGATAQVISEHGLKGPLLLIAGDNYFGFRIEDFMNAYRGTTLLASYDTKSLQTARQFGVLEVDQGRLVSFAEKPFDPRSTLISTGCYLFSPDHLPFIQEYSLRSADNLGGIFEFLLDRGQAVEVFSFDEPWIDIGSFESYLQAHRDLLTGHRIAPGSLVKDSRLGASVEIGKDCEIEHCEIENSIVMEGCRLRNARIRSCIVDQDCVIDGVDLDHKMVRRGARIEG